MGRVTDAFDRIGEPMKVELELCSREIDTSANSRTCWNERRWCEVRLFDDSNRVGRGIAAPLPEFSDETLEDAVAELERFAAFVENESFSRAAIDHALRKTPVMLPSVRFCLDVAASQLDALQKAQSFSEHLAGRFSEVKPAPVRVARWLREQDPPEAAMGFAAVKLKIGKNLQHDLERIAAVRARCPDAQIRVDANRCLDPAIVADLAGAYAHLGVGYLEEPCDPEVLLTLDRLPVGLAFDETLSESRAFALLKELREVHRIRALSIKPTRLGDFKNVAFWCRNAQNWSAEPVFSHCLEPDPVFAVLLSCASLYPESVHGLGAHSALIGDYEVQDGAFIEPALGWVSL